MTPAWPARPVSPGTMTAKSPQNRQGHAQDRPPAVPPASPCDHVCLTLGSHSKIILAGFTGLRPEPVTHRDSGHHSPNVHTGPHPPDRCFAEAKCARHSSRCHCSSRWRLPRQDCTTGAAPARSSSQRGQPGVRRPKAGPPHVCFVVPIPEPYTRRTAVSSNRPYVVQDLLSAGPRGAAGHSIAPSYVSRVRNQRHATTGCTVCGTRAGPSRTHARAPSWASRRPRSDQAARGQLGPGSPRGARGPAARQVNSYHPIGTVGFSTRLAPSDIPRFSRLSAPVLSVLWWFSGCVVHGIRRAETLRYICAYLPGLR
jgi:hypothetical protein